MGRHKSIVESLYAIYHHDKIPEHDIHLIGRRGPKKPNIILHGILHGPSERGESGQWKVDYHAKARE